MYTVDLPRSPGIALDKGSKGIGNSNTGSTGSIIKKQISSTSERNSKYVKIIKKIIKLN
jgi:hypothetical protein